MSDVGIGLTRMGDGLGAISNPDEVSELRAYLAPSRAFRGVTQRGTDLRVYRDSRLGWERVR
jgi:hypothetical protein